MKLKLILALLLGAIINTSCNTETTVKAEPKPLELPLNYTVLQLNDSTNKFFTKANLTYRFAKAATLNEAELVSLDKRMKQCIKEYNARRDQNIKVDDYYKQYLPVTLRNGEKTIFIQCFCENNYPNWENELIQVKDGGNCFFNMKININKGKCWSLKVNGDA